MTGIRCQHTTCMKARSFGKHHVQRWKCTSCKNRFSEPHAKLTRDTRLPRAPRGCHSRPAAVALHFAYYNFCRVHASHRVTPAMEAGIANHIWTITELLEGL